VPISTNPKRLSLLKDLASYSRVNKMTGLVGNTGKYGGEEWREMWGGGNYVTGL
jgi:hypothetical protein